MREGVVEIDGQIAQTLAIRSCQGVIIRPRESCPGGKSTVLRLVERMWTDDRQLLHIEHRCRPVIRVDERILIYRLRGGDAWLRRIAQSCVHSRYGKEILEVRNNRDSATGRSHLAERYARLPSLLQNGRSRIEVHAALGISQVRWGRDVLLREKVASEASDVRQRQHPTLGHFALVRQADRVILWSLELRV